MSSIGFTPLEINGKTYKAILKPMKVARNKLWGKDTGRSISGKMKGTLIGIYPKIQASIDFTTEDDLKGLCDELDKAEIAIKYYSAKHKAMVFLGTYSADYETILISTNPVDYDPTEITFISLDKE